MQSSTATKSGRPFPNHGAAASMITYRTYENRDWKAICQIHDRARPDELHNSCDPRAFVPLEQDKEVEELKACKKFVACDDDKVIGFVGVDGDFLAWLYVDPAHYGQGVGRQLLRLAVREIGEGAWTIVLDENRTAITLYESEGFQEIERFKGENAGYPCTCIRMKRL
jgi:ribosomal protein S18 acetylase RimI-like enzyme